MAKAAGESDINIAWGVATDNDLTIWVGLYSDTPSPSISNKRAIVKWTTPITLHDMAVSPDHQSLAVLTQAIPVPGQEGMLPAWLYVIDLNTNAVQVVPDYYTQYKLFEFAFYNTPNRILGWLDNNRFSVQQLSGQSIVAVANKDGSAYASLPFPGVYNSAPDSALSSDQTTFISIVGGLGGGFWLYNTDGSNPRQIVDHATAKPFFYPIWAPDDSYISFLSPQEVVHEGSRFRNMNVWILDPVSASQRPISTATAWDVEPAWSLDSSDIAFLRADAPVTDDNFASWYDNPTQVNTNVYTASMSDLTPHQLTGFQGVNNTDLSWTAGGNIIMASSYSINSLSSWKGLPNLIAVSGQDGIATMLINGSQGQWIEHPVLFR